MQNRIRVTISPNEAARTRSTKIEKAIVEDSRFELAESCEIPFDLRFSIDPLEYHVELKDFSGDGGSDYLGSILNGHLYEQVLAAREMQIPLAIVVLGDDNDVGEAIRKAASRTGRMNVKKLMDYFRMVEGFEAKCIRLKIPVWRLKTDPYWRILLRVREILDGGDLTGFAPHPAEGERQAVGLSILAGRGIGPKKARSILEHFRIVLEPRTSDDYLTDCDGIGSELALRIRKQIDIGRCNVCRPKGLER